MIRRQKVHFWEALQDFQSLDLNRNSEDEFKQS